MALTPISTGDTGASVRAKINAGFAATDAVAIDIANTADRPGDSPKFFTNVTPGLPEALTSLPSENVVAVSGRGRVARATGTAVVAAKRVVRIEGARKYRVRAGVRRAADSGDPSGDAVVLAVQMLAADGSASGSPVALATLTDLTVASGARVVDVVVSTVAAGDVNVVLPSGVYARVYWHAYGSTCQTDIEFIGQPLDVTDALAEAAARAAAITAEATARAEAVSSEAAARAAAVSAEASARTSGDLDVIAALLRDVGRPGDRPDLFTAVLTGTPDSLPPLSPSGAVTVADRGQAYRLTGGGVVARRRMWKIESGRRYRVRGVIRRVTSVASTDEFVSFNLLALAADGTTYVGVSLLHLAGGLTAGQRVAVEVVMSTVPGEGVDVVLPAGIIYGRPYWYVQPGVCTTDVEYIGDLEDVTDWGTLSPNVTGVSARVDALEGLNADVRLQVLEAAQEDLRAVEAQVARDAAAVAVAADSIGANAGASVSYRALMLGVGARHWPAASDAAFPGLISSYGLWSDGAVRPSSFDAALDFARASAATYINSAGALASVTSGNPRVTYDGGVLQGVVLEPAGSSGPRNNTMLGAAAGTLPTNWNFVAGQGLSVDALGSVVYYGVTYFRVRVHGTATGTNALTCSLEASNVIPATSGQAINYNMMLALEAGTQKLCQLRLRQQNSSATTLAEFQGPYIATLTSTPEPFDISPTLLTNAATTHVRPMFQVSGWSVGENVDFTLTMGVPQVSNSEVAQSFVPSSTTSALTSRAADVLTGALGAEFNALGYTALFAFTRRRSPISASVARLWQLDDGSENNRLTVRFSGDRLIAEAVSGGSVVATVTGPPVRGGRRYNVAVAAGDGVLTLSVNGQRYAPASLSALPSGLTTRRIGCDASGGNQPTVALQPYLLHPSISALDGTEYAIRLPADLMDRFTVLDPGPGLPRLSTLAAIGDSITVGAASSIQMLAWLDRVSLHIGAGTPLNKGVSGCVLQNSGQSGGNPGVNNMRDRFAADLLGANKREGVIIAGGINDARTTAFPATLNVANYGVDLREMLNGLIAGGYDRQDICIVTPYWITDSALSSVSQTRSGYEAYVTMAATVAAEYGTWLADAYSYMRDNGGDSLISGDNLHPTDAGHAVIDACVRLNAVLANRRSAIAGLTPTSPVAGQISISGTAPGGDVTSYDWGVVLDGAYAYGNAKTSVSPAASWTGLAAGTYRVRGRPLYSDGVYGPWGVSGTVVVT